MKKEKADAYNFVLYFYSMKNIFFEIDANSKIGKQVLPLLKGLSETSIGINFITEEDAENRVLAMMMKKSAHSGIAPKKRVLAKLGIK